MFARKSEGEQTVDKKADHSSPAEGRDIVARPSSAVREPDSTASRGRFDVCAALSLILPESFDPLMTALGNIPDNVDENPVVKRRVVAFADDHRKAHGTNKLTGECYDFVKRGYMKKDCLEKSNANVATGLISIVSKAKSYPVRSLNSC